MGFAKLGSWAFIIGLVIAVLFGLFGTAGSTTMMVLAVLGLIVGLLNVTHGEAHMYLIASIAFLLSANSLTMILSSLGEMMKNIVTFVAPGAAIVALRALYDIAKAK